MALLSQTFQVKFRNWFPKITLRQITDIFDAAGFQPGPVPWPPPDSSRRDLAAHDLSQVSWESATDTQKLLDAVTIALFSHSVPKDHRDALKLAGGP
jgi:hypothetical protein